MLIVVFESTNEAIKGEKRLLADSLKVTVMPLPSAIKAGCGIALKINAEEQEKIFKILNAEKIPFEVYEAHSGKEYKLIYKSN